MITITATSTQDYIGTLGDLKVELKITDSIDDTLLVRLLKSASRRIEKEIGRPILRQSYRETIRGNGLPEILLTHRPIVSVSAIFYGSDTGSPFDVDSYVIEDDEAGIIYSENGFYWDAGYAPGLEYSRVTGQGRRSYTIDYIAGWVYPGSTGEPRTLPEPIEQAILELTKFTYKNININSNISEKKIGDVNVRYGSQADGIAATGKLPQSVEILLGPYRSVI